MTITRTVIQWGAVINHLSAGDVTEELLELMERIDHTIRGRPLVADVTITFTDKEAEMIPPLPESLDDQSLPV